MRGLLFALLGLVALAAAQSAAANDARTRDVCIIGGGASGMASAVFLKDRGYDVLVLEVAERVGGHCDTVRTGAPLFSPTGDLLYPGYTDVGVVVYQDTKRANDSTPPLPPGSKGTWSLDSRAFASRFAQTVPLDFTSTERRGANAGTLYVDLNLGIAAPNPNLSDAQLQAIQAAIGAAVGRIYATTLQYPWLNTGKRPDPLPSFFLEPFTNFIRNNSLEILIQPLFFGLLTGGGMGTLSLLTTVEALQVLAPVTLDLFQQAGSGFVVAGGCQTLYDSIAAYVGANNIRLKADIRGVHRAGSRVVISGFYGDGKRFQNGRPLDYKGDDVEEDSAEDPADGGNKKGTPFVYQCRKLIMGIYPVLPNLNMLDLSNEEYALFSQMEANYYMAIAVNATGGSLANSGFTLNNVNFLNQPTQESLLPSLSTLTRSFPAGPIAAYVNSDSEVPLTYDQALKLATDGFAKIPTDLLNGFSIVSVSYHLYDPHFKPAALAATPSADTRLANLQGKQNTFWVGAGTRYDASSVVWNQAFELVSANFPPKN